MTLLSCGVKKEFLDEKPSSDVFIPTTIDDLRALLDNDVYNNEMTELGTLSADEYYFMPGFWESLGAKERNCYIWSSDIFEGQGRIRDYNLPYKQVFYANVVLEELAKNSVPNASQTDIEEVKGTALFIRGLAFFNVAQQFAGIYDESSSGSDPGISIRLVPDVDERATRSTLKASYDQIFEDLNQAVKLLPDSVPVLLRNRPSKPAAFALLARIYLSMRNYQKAHQFADSSLKYYSKLIDYDSINPNAFLPFSPQNNETLYQGRLNTLSAVVNGVNTPACVIDSNLFKSYDANDLRRSIYFIRNTEGLPCMKGGYSGTILTFGGLAVDEVIMIRAECLARANKVNDAMNALNGLIRLRYIKNTYVNKVALTAEQALKIILEERKKELVFRGVRWTDLKRLNREGAAIRLTRVLNGVTYRLEPNDPKYILPIPPDVIALTGMAQNQR
ncbi:MAG: RagB/SusD family nutrient uptake outer membrane protein [Pseudobacter sp.]|uniref:RagB/SusD family nutrient uptake outer membrane protein n=1 Tax=Pseudobacter sp. TaxID=2045420 RepID=UPI003F80EE91